MFEPPLKPKDSRKAGSVDAFVLSDSDTALFEKKDFAGMGSVRSETDKSAAKTVRIPDTSPFGATFVATPRNGASQSRYGNGYPARPYPVVPVQQPAVAPFHAAERQISTTDLPKGQFEIRDTVRMAEPRSPVPANGSQGGFLGNNHGFSGDIDSALNHLVISEPLLSEEEIIALLNEDRYGRISVTRRSLKKALRRNGLENGAKRFRVYMAG